jgi:SAM-dependent methyltransferase
MILPPGFEPRACPACGTSKGIPQYVIHYESDRVLSALDLNAPPPEVRLHRCSSCPHHYASPHIETALLSQYYSELTSEFYAGPQPSRDPRARQHQALVDAIEHRVGRGQVLDVGYGYGFLLSCFSPERWTRVGVEPSSVGSRLARERGHVDQHWGSLEEFLDHGGTVDVVLMMDLVEHLSDMRPLLHSARQVLTLNGLLVIGTGNVRSINAMLSRGWWGYFRSWEHVSFYSPASMRWALNDAGFTSVRIVSTRHAGDLRDDVVNAAHNITTGVKNSLKLAMKRAGGSNRPSRTGALVHDHMVAFATRRRFDA